MSVIVLGSFARGEAYGESDLEVAFVRPQSVGEEDHGWHRAVATWRHEASRLTGNVIEVLEVGEPAAARLLRSRRPLWGDIQHDSVVVFGIALGELRERRSG